jgi:O-antigen ligase
MPARPKSPRATTAAVTEPRPSERWAAIAVGALVVGVPLVLIPAALDQFRLPKLLAAEWLGLLSVLLLAWQVRVPDAGAGRRLLEGRALRALAPLVLLATLGLLWTDHPEHVRRALPSLWIGAACLIAWSNGFERETLARLVRLGALPAALLALLSVLQFHGLFRPFGYETNFAGSRMGVTSLAGNAGDLGAFLLLPCLVAQERIWRQRGRARWLWAAALALGLYGLAVSQTLTALAAVAAGSALLWALLLPRRRAGLILVAGLAAAALAIAAVAPLRVRVAQKLGDVARGDVASLLTYRLDGWAAAGWLLGQHPLTGVGHGAFVTEFTAAKSALLERGRLFPDRGTTESTFANAHNDLLEVGAELGWPGLLAAAWATVTLASAAWRQAPPERALAVAGVSSMAVVALAGFPFETALVAYSWLVFLAWMVSSEASRSNAPVEAAVGVAPVRQPKRGRR